MNKLRKTEAFEANKKSYISWKILCSRKYGALYVVKLREYKNAAESEKIRLCGICFVLRENLRELRDK